MIVETIIGVIVISIALFMYFVGKDVKEQPIHDSVLHDISKDKSSYYAIIYPFHLVQSMNRYPSSIKYTQFL